MVGGEVERLGCWVNDQGAMSEEGQGDTEIGRMKRQDRHGTSEKVKDTLGHKDEKGY